MELGLAKLPRYGQIGVFMLLASMGAATFRLYYEAPVRAEVAGKERQLAGLRADIDKARATANRLPDLRTQTGELESRLESLSAALPTEKDAADLLRRLQVVALQSNLTIKAFRPAAPIDKPLHAEWPIGLELDGAYHNLAAFFDRVGRFMRVINITALEMKLKENSTEGSTITASCVATAFVLTGKEKRAVAFTLPAGGTVAMPSRPASAAERAIRETSLYGGRGRRDPFVSVLGGRVEPPSVGDRVEGAAGLRLAEIRVRGVMQGRGTAIAMIQGPDDKTYLVRPGDRLADAMLESISRDGLVFRQDVRDRLSGVKHNEVRKPLRSVERVKP